MSKDKYAPSLNFKEDVAIWKFPSFENNANEQTEYLLKKYKDKLESTPFWILDLSNNSGGDYSIGLQLLDYIYTKPILNYNAEMRMTQSNFEKWYQFIADYYNNADDKTKKALDERMNKMKAHYGKLYNESGTPTDTLKLDKVKVNPKKIALLINKNTVSSGELFTILARQSDKVIVMGTNSGGMMDYGNVVTYKTSFPTIKIQLPINRQLWLDNNFSVDKEGLKPDVYLKEDNWIEQAIKLIKE
jgi:C-terminal processing protease CtpA/Prc